ncbi:MAG: AAA family ATPase, partial [Synergistaceae bacterium]
MIEELIVHGVGGIKDARLEFGGQFIVITGESGSGKSSLVRALEFISGKRAQTSLIHTNDEMCDVQLAISTTHI